MFLRMICWRKGIRGRDFDEGEILKSIFGKPIFMKGILGKNVFGKAMCMFEKRCSGKICLRR